MATLTLFKWKDEFGPEQTFQLVNKVSAKWQSIGIILGITFNTLEGWRVEALNNATTIWNKVMNYWLTGQSKSNYPITRQGLYSMLEDIEASEVAKELKIAVTNIYNLLFPPRLLLCL